VTIRVEDWATHPHHFWLRGKPPEKLVEYDEELKMWNVYGYPEAVEILTNPAIFSNDAGRLDLVKFDDEINAGDFAQMDPPQHRKVRGLVDHAFTPNLVARIAPRVDALIHELLDKVDGQERFDLVGDFATPLPLTVILELLGVPTSDWEQFHRWMHRMMAETDDFVSPEEALAEQDALQKAMNLLFEMRDYWNELAKQRRKQPREDLLSQLVHAEVDGEKLAPPEVFNIANRLLIAGHHSTSIMIGNTMLSLDAFPEERERVREDRSLVPTLIEESIRFVTPISAVGRATNVDVEVAGTVIPKDQVVMVWVGAANRDERQFDNPHVLDAGRAPNPHLGFGRGVHFCIGRRLARMEGRAAVNILLDRFPKLRTDPDNPPTFYQIADAGGVETLPVLTG
jgi:cytochrome P450